MQCQKKISVLLFVLTSFCMAGGFAAILAGCMHYSESGSSITQETDTNVTADFLSKVGGQAYVVGPKKTASDKNDEVLLAADGTVKIKHNSSYCPYIETGSISKVTKLAYMSQYRVSYYLSDVQLVSESDSSTCHQYLADYRQGLPKNRDDYACGYNSQYVDFSCTKDMTGSGNWIVKH